MTVIAEVVLRGVSREEYAAVRAECRWLEEPPDGGIAHLTWWDGEDCRNVDAWADEDAFAAFGEQRLGPAMARAGVGVQPEVTFHPAHEVYRTSAGVDGEGAPASASDVEVLRRGYAAFAAGDVPAALAIFDDGLDWYTPDSVEFGGRFRGPQEVAGFFGRLPQHFAELNVQPQTFLDAGGTVVVLGRLSGRTAADRPFDLPFVHVWTLRNGKATSFTENFDTARMNEALGPAAAPRPQIPAQPGSPEQPTRV
jgi:uncharacterized protein